MANGIPSYLQDAGKDLAAQMTKTYSTPLQTGAFTPQVAPQDAMQTSAIGMAQAGIDSYKPYLTQAQTALGQAGTAVGGLGALTGASAYQPFMSPYQTDVIDETLRQYDLSRTQGEQSIQDAAVASGQAQNAAQQAFQNQQAIANMYTGLGGQQMGLSNFERAGMGQDIAAMGRMGSSQQAYEQAKLNRDAQAAQMQAYEPYGRLSQYASGITGLAGGMAPMQYQAPGPSDPWATALGSALGIGGLYGKIFN